MYPRHSVSRAVALTALECRRCSGGDEAVSPAHDSSNGWRSLPDPLRYWKICGRGLPGRASNADIVGSAAIPVDCHCPRVSGCGDHDCENPSYARTDPSPFFGLCCIGLRNCLVVRQWRRLSRVEPQICTAELGLPLNVHSSGISIPFARFLKLGSLALLPPPGPRHLRFWPLSPITLQDS